MRYHHPYGVARDPVIEQVPVTFVLVHVCEDQRHSALIPSKRSKIQVRTLEMILMQFDRHSDARHHDVVQQIHIAEDPLVLLRRDAEVALEQRVQAVHERLHGDVTENDSQTRVVRLLPYCSIPSGRIQLRKQSRAWVWIAGVLTLYLDLDINYLIIFNFSTCFEQIAAISGFRVEYDRKIFL